MDRNKEIDIMRGTGIVLMVIGHSGFIYRDFIYLFHMAVLFMLSGYLYNDKYSKDIKSVFEFIKRRLHTLWLPCFFYQSFFILCNNLFIKLNVYTLSPDFAKLTPGSHKELGTIMSDGEIIVGIIKSFLFLGESQLGGVFWFFQTLFGVAIIFCVTDYILRKVIERNLLIIAHIGISAGLLIIGYLEVTPINMVNRICSCYCLYCFGKLICCHFHFLKRIKRVSWYLFGAVAFVLLIFLNNEGHISLNINTYENPLFLFICSVLGWILIYAFSIAILRIPLLRNMVQTLGGHTVAIAALHFLAFKLVNVAQVFIYHKPLFLIASFPVMYSDHMWWLFYTVVGLSLPCVLSMVYEKMKISKKRWNNVFGDRNKVSLK